MGKIRPGFRGNRKKVKKQPAGVGGVGDSGRSVVCRQGMLLAKQCTVFPWYLLPHLNGPAALQVVSGEGPARGGARAWEGYMCIPEKGRDLTIAALGIWDLVSRPHPLTALRFLL